MGLPIRALTAMTANVRNSRESLTMPHTREALGDGGGSTLQHIGKMETVEDQGKER